MGCRMFGTNLLSDAIFPPHDLSSGKSIRIDIHIRITDASYVLKNELPQNL